MGLALKAFTALEKTADTQRLLTVPYGNGPSDGVQSTARQLRTGVRIQ